MSFFLFGRGRNGVREVFFFLDGHSICAEACIYHGIGRWL